MSYFDPEEFKRMFEAGEPDFGDDGSPLPKGWYPLRMFPVKIDETKNGVPRVLVSYTVTHGPKAGRNFLQEQYLDASPVERQKDEDGNWIEIQRDEDTYKNKQKAAAYRLKGMLSAANIEIDETARGEGGKEFLVNYFNVEAWKNATLMGNVDIRRDRNNVKGFRTLEDEKYGLEAFLTRLEAKQLA